jgi:hypothetical protein
VSSVADQVCNVHCCAKRRRINVMCPPQWDRWKASKATLKHSQVWTSPRGELAVLLEPAMSTHWPPQPDLLYSQHTKRFAREM